MCNEDGCFAALQVALLCLSRYLQTFTYNIIANSDLHFIFRFFQHIISYKKVTQKIQQHPTSILIIQSVCVFLFVRFMPAFRSNLPRNRDVLVGWQDLLNEIASSSRRLRAARGGAQDAAGGAAVTPGPGRSRSPESRPRPVGFWGGFLEGGAWD